MLSPNRHTSLGMASKSELPELLQTSYSTFMSELDLLLQKGNDLQLFDLFDRYPAVHTRLLEASAQLGLFGFPSQSRQTLYRCDNGPHCVKDVEVVERDDGMNALCPKHHTIMTAVTSCP
jgi:hypothetical protein